METGTAVVTERKPETRALPGLNDFLKRQREATVPAPTDTQPQTDGQSEPATGQDQPKADAAAPDAQKTDKKEKTAEELKKELSSQSKANLRLGAEKAELQRQLETLKAEHASMKAQLEGTAPTPSKEAQEQKAVLEAEFAKFEQRRDASKQTAIEQFGEEAVLSQIYVDEAPFATLTKAKPWLTQRVIAAEQPIVEAMAILNEEAVLTKFGRTEADVLKKAEALLRPKLWEQFKTELEQADGGAKPSPVVPSLNRAKSAGGDSRTGVHEPVRTFSALNLNPHNRV